MNKVFDFIKTFFDTIIDRIINHFGEIPLCNGKIERGFKIGNFVLPLCARCSFIFIGLIVGLFFVIKFIEKKKIKTITSILIGIVLILPTTIDGLIQTFSNYESNNIIRSVTGFFAGVGFVFIISIITNWIIKLTTKK